MNSNWSLPPVQSCPAASNRPPAPIEMASRARRLIAAIIDMVMMLVLLYGVFNGLLNLLISPAPVEWSESAPSVEPQGWAVAGVLFLVWLGVQLTLLVCRGQTLAKWLLGMRIVRPDGSPVSAARILGLRYAVFGLIASLPWLGFAFQIINYLLIFRDSRQCLHDEIADTIVVKTRP